jgi:riboflavin kinase/FMN adenylyltransferase
VRPTFHKTELTVEVHVFDFNEDLYSEEISIYFIQKIREEKKFENAEALVQQITTDITDAKTMLASHS